MPIPVKVTPYYQALLDRLGDAHPLRRSVFPDGAEAAAPEEYADPLGEEQHSPLPGIIHTYPDKILLLVTLNCAAHCRYCTRGRLIGTPSPSLTEETYSYIEQHSVIRDVLISGGDPLTLADKPLDGIIARLRRIQHIRTIRLGTKVPAVLPARITPSLADILAAHRVWLQLHFIHPDELTAETTSALQTLADAGVPMVSQTVLLKGINDSAETLADLFYGLLERRVKPYYLFQCDPVTGSAPFRTRVEQGLNIMSELQGRVSGLALPHYAVDAPGGGGKITLLPGAPLLRDGNNIVLTNHAGKTYFYPDGTE